MKKFLRFSLVALFAVLGMSNAMAGKIVFAEITPALENGVQYTEPFDGGDFTVTFAGGGNDGKYYTTGSGIRVYGDGTMTITAKAGGKLTKILITYDGTNKPASANDVNCGTYDPETGLWTGEAETVVFTRPSGSGHWRVKAIATNDDVQTQETPTEGQTPEGAITVTRALEIINALADGKTTDALYYVKGYVTSIDRIQTTASFFIGETAEAEETVKAYNLKGFKNENVTNPAFLEAGDEVIVYGTLQKYVKNKVVTPEVTSGYVYSVNGETEDTTPNPEDAIQGGTVEEPLTVDQALGYINGFTDGFTTTKQYYVKGTVSSDPEISTENGNATFDMSGTSGTLTIFRVKGLENNSITKKGYVENGDEVIIYAKLQKYVKDDTTTPEMTSGYIYSLNGETKEPETPVDFEGDGTKENPYTVGDLKQMKESTYPTEEVWVKGVIIGSAKSKLALHEGTDEDANAASNIAIAAEATRASSLEFIPVKLDAETIFRTQLNVLDNPSNIGEEVLLKGKISSYFSTTGVTNLSAAVFKGETITGISALTIDTNDNAPMYNLKGERVDANYRGVVIKGGKKTIQK